MSCGLFFSFPYMIHLNLLKNKGPKTSFLSIRSIVVFPAVFAYVPS